MVSFFFMLFNL